MNNFSVVFTVLITLPILTTAKNNFKSQFYYVCAGDCYNFETDSELLTDIGLYECLISCETSLNCVEPSYHVTKRECAFLRNCPELCIKEDEGRITYRLQSFTVQVPNSGSLLHFTFPAWTIKHNSAIFSTHGCGVAYIFFQLKSKELVAALYLSETVNGQALENKVVDPETEEITYVSYPYNSSALPFCSSNVGVNVWLTWRNRTIQAGTGSDIGRNIFLSVSLKENYVWGEINYLAIETQDKDHKWIVTMYNSMYSV